MGTRLKNQLVTISEMSELIAIGTRTQLADEYGALDSNLSHTTPSIRAKVRYVDTDESEQQLQEKYTQNIKVWIRYGPSVSVMNYIYWNSTYWEIKGIETIDGKRFYVIKCQNITQ